MGNNCKRNSWIAAAVLGIVVFLIALPGFFWALVLGAVVALILGFVLTTFFCKEDDASPSGLTSSQSASAVAAPAAAPQPTGATNTGTASGDVTKPTPLMETGTPAEPEEAAVPDAEPTATTASATAEAAASEPEAKPAPAEATDGTKPAGLSAARDGQADDLKKIKGVGPKLEIMLNEMGYFHFDQIAAWTAEEVAWVDQNLKGFKGRVSRDSWVDQASALASGEQTEFSKRVDKGDVY